MTELAQNQDEATNSAKGEEVQVSNPQTDTPQRPQTQGEGKKHLRPQSQEDQRPGIGGINEEELTEYAMLQEGI